MGKRKPYQMRLNGGHVDFANEPIIFYRYGYLWIGNNAEDDKKCFAYLPEHKTVRMAKAIIAMAKQRAKAEN
jgi:hypothetical protein